MPNLNQKKGYDPVWVCPDGSPNPYNAKIESFEEIKRREAPNDEGLYTAEMMLLLYVSYGDYPKPRSGYPGRWWYQFGIRDVRKCLIELEKRGYITWTDKEEWPKKLYVKEIKEILSCHNIKYKSSDTKTILIGRLTGIPNWADIIPSFCIKYKLTDKGQTAIKNFNNT